MEAKEFYQQHETRMKALDVSLGQFKEYEKRFDDMDEALKGLQTQSNRPPIPSQTTETRGVKDWHDSEIRSFAKSGEFNLDNVEAETRALYQADQTTGGYFAQTEWVNELLRNIVLYSEIAGSVGSRNTAATSVEMPVYDHSFGAQWTGAEIATKSETTGQSFGMKQITTHELYALIDMSQKDLEDSRFDIEGYMMQEFALQFAVAEAYAILYGTGVGQPEGILSTNAGLFGGVTTAAQDVIDPNDFKNLFWALLPNYSRMPGSAFVMHTGLVQALDMFRGVNEKQYVWQPGITNDPLKDGLMGHPIVIAPEMPINNTAGRGTVGAVYGNLQRGYMLVNRIDTQILRDPYTQATKGLIRFIARRRVGGKVILPEAIKTMTLHA